MTASPTTSQLHVDVLMRASRLFTSVVAASIVQTGEAVTVAQLRVLVLVATRQSANASGVARHLGVHVSSASRLCDRLVTAGLLHRAEDPVDRRNIVLTLTDQGTTLLEAIMEHRRQALTEILDRMAPADRAALSRGLGAFADAGGEPAGGGAAF